MLLWDSLWNSCEMWTSCFIRVTCPALMIFLRSGFSSCEFSTLILGDLLGLQVAVVFFKSSCSSSFLCKTRVICLRTKQWASLLNNGVSLKMLSFALLPILFMVISFSLPQSKCNCLFFCLYSCWKCECSSPFRQDIKFYSGGTVKLGTETSWLKFRKSKYSGWRKRKATCGPSWDLSSKPV